MDKVRAYAFRHSDGTIDLDTIAKTPGVVRDLLLQDAMGWRFDHPERYDQDATWQRWLQHGRVVEVEITRVDNNNADGVGD